MLGHTVNYLNTTFSGEFVPGRVLVVLAIPGPLASTAPDELS